ncbi:MAG: glycerol-3-phosphate 1-O-acyltransferase PlsY [Methylophilus sp.]|nr:glycerol-3-phosphate 1-O-acyltransferase PlsY [Methylophilus sp.]
MSELGFIPVTLIPMVWIVVAYLIGSISFGIIVSKVYGLPDPRTVGSGNIGATNVARSGKKSAAILTLLGDAFKGWLPVWLALQSVDVMWVVACVGLAVFFGHLYPIFHKFKGGKGVATALGVMLGVSGWLALGAVLVWVVVFAASRISSLSALVAAVAAPIIAWFLLSPYPDYVWMVLVMSMFLIWRHKTNIRKLLNGTESGFKKK